MSNTQTSSGGIGFCGLLALIFITLKLTGHITWSWIWVLAPLWITVLLVIGIMGFIAFCFFVAILLNNIKKNK